MVRDVTVKDGTLTVDADGGEVQDVAVEAGSAVITVRGGGRVTGVTVGGPSAPSRSRWIVQAIVVPLLLAALGVLLRRFL